MKHYLITAITMALCLVPSISHAYDFEAVNDDGVTIYYNILSEADKTCEVTYQILTWEYDERQVFYTGYLRIPQYANGYKVVAIGEYAFQRCYDLTSIFIPSSITYVESSSWCDISKVNIEVPDIAAWCNKNFECCCN